MFRYFYRIWDKFRYKHKDRSEIVAAAIYTYKGDRGKDKSYVYKLPEIEKEILVYNFKTIDVEKIELEKISEDNPLKLVFKMGKSLLETNTRDEDIYEAKIKLAEELKNYDKVKNNDQIRKLHYKEEGREEGREEGIEKQAEEARLKDVERVKKLLAKKFGILSEENSEKISKASSEKLSIIIENILDVENLEDSIKYLG